MTITNIINKLKEKSDLTKEDISIIFSNFKEKRVSNEEIKELVIAWNEKGHKPQELIELSKLLNTEQKQKELDIEALDMCGTGGDKCNTFNISTLAGIVSSSCGAKIIKHSGRSTTSISGSVDILGQIGFDIDQGNEIKENCFKQTGLMFVSSKLLREVFGEVKVVCKNINSPGFVNLLGPLTNPYKTKFHLLGVSSTEWGELLASVLMREKKEAFVVCCKINEDKYLDELSFCGTNYIWHVKSGRIDKNILRAKDFGINFQKVKLNDLVVKDINDNRVIFESLLKGKLDSNDPKVKTVALNSGAALYLIKKANSIFEGYNITLKIIQSGKAWEHLKIFLNCNK